MSLIGYARINKRSTLVCEAIQEMYDQGKLNFSFEISAGSVSVVNGITIVDASEDNELTAMAVVSIPAYPESTALDLVAEAEQSIDQFYANAHVLISEVDFETVRERFFKLLYQHRCCDIEPFWPRVLLFCLDCVIFYETASGKIYKVEYMMDGEDIVIKDVYEVKFERSEGSEEEMNDINEMTQEEREVQEMSEATEEVVAETVAEATATENGEETAEQIAEAEESHEEVQAEVTEEVSAESEEPAEDPRVAELQRKLDEANAELNRLKAEREEAENNAEREKMIKFVEMNGLNNEGVIAEAIEKLDHKTLMSEVMVMSEKKEAKPEVNTGVREHADIGVGSRSYLFDRG